jgi:hypothetical protein
MSGLLSTDRERERERRRGGGLRLSKIEFHVAGPGVVTLRESSFAAAVQSRNSSRLRRFEAGKGIDVCSSVAVVRLKKRSLVSYQTGGGDKLRKQKQKRRPFAKQIKRWEREGKGITKEVVLKQWEQEKCGSGRGDGFEGYRVQVSSDTATLPYGQLR